MFKLDLEEEEKPDIKLPTFSGSLKKQGSSRKTPTSAVLGASLVAQMAKRMPAMWETQVLFLGWEDPLEKEMAIHSSTLAWKIPWTKEPDRLQSMELQRVRHD